ncbi:MAG: DNA methyltransferase [Gallionella sp.]|nr:DNA methyltransferase [Gallionella sp.]MDD4958957.1 DNA methyltransferase [Gallionella sp.]
MSQQDKQDTAQLALLKKHFANCFDKHGAFIPAKLQAIVQDSGAALSKEGYSLNWLGKSYARLLANEAIRTRLVADAAHNAKPDHAASQNLLIKGDNLDVLKHLMGAYSEQVKMIYIDPPYNTGSDGFVYQDDRKFTAPQLSELAGIDETEARRILEFTQAKSNSHSAWLTFMYPRLYLARQLLRDDGVIFISIDDNEQAQLKILCDEVFGEENFVANFIWKSRQNKDNRSKNGASIDHEYALAYGRSIRGVDRNLNGYSNPDNDPRGDWTSANMVGLATPDRRPNLHYDLVDPTTGINYGCPPMGWRYDRKTMAKLVEERRILWPSISEGRPRRKAFVADLSSEQTGCSSIVGKDLYTRNGTADVDALFGLRIMDFPKPVSLIKELVQQVDSGIILDFFAGSGTTAHAVMLLNAEDGGNRRFICVQIAEATDPKSEAHKAGYPTIFDITQARIEKAATKIKETLLSTAPHPHPSLPLEGEGTVATHPQPSLPLEEEGTVAHHPQPSLPLEEEGIIAPSPSRGGLGRGWGEKKLDLGFKIFATQPMFDKYLDTPDELTENLELFEASSLNAADRQSLLLTWAVRDGIRLGAPLEAVDLGGYTAYAAGKILYFVEPDLTLDAVIAVLEQLDNNPAFAPSRLVVFGWGLDSKIQREMTEAVKGYNNRKGIELTLDIRFN